MPLKTSKSSLPSRAGRAFSGSLSDNRCYFAQHVPTAQAVWVKFQPPKAVQRPGLNTLAFQPPLYPEHPNPRVIATLTRRHQSFQLEETQPHTQSVSGATAKDLSLCGLGALSETAPSSLGICRMVETRSASQEDDGTSSAPSAENPTSVADDAFGGEGIVKVGEGTTEAERALQEIERWEKKTGYLPKFLEGSLDGVEAGFGKAYTDTFDDDAAGARMQRAMLDHGDKREAIGLTNRRKRETKAVETAGPKWFDMRKPKMTPELEKDLKVLRMRQHLDPSKHYKSTGWTGKGPAFFEAGTVVDSSHDYVAGRINKRERKQHLKDEILDDDGVRERAKRRFHEVQAKTQSGRQGGPTNKRPRKRRLAKR